jgi:hypothetical protein
MPLEGSQSDVLQKLGVTYPQLIDYSSKQYTATLVNPSQFLQTVRSILRRFKSALWY